MYRFKLFLLFVLLCLCSCVSQQSFGPVISRVGFGSCLKIEYSTEQLWDSIRSSRPNLFIFAGDNVYADSSDPAVLQKYYDKLENEAGFRRLRSMVPLLAVYDDHDYGTNDGGNDNPIRDEAARACLDFFRVPLSDPRRKHKGLYGSYTYGPAGSRLQVILLDTRYFRDPLVKSKEPGKRYSPNKNPEATLLGDEQWLWLDKALREPADVRLIVSSIQVIPDKRGMESWGNFPLERQKLFRLIEKNKAEGVLFISGDAHFSEVSKYQPGGYPLYDITSSAMAHNHNSKDGKPTKYSNFPNEYRLKGSDFTAGNFGLISIQWKGKDTLINIALKDTGGKDYFTYPVKLEDLQFKK